MFSQNEISLKDAIKSLIQSYNMHDRIHEAQLNAAWSNIVGPYAAKHTVDMYLFKGVLQIKLNSDVIRQELSYAKSRIIIHINKYLGKKVVENIIFR